MRVRRPARRGFGGISGAGFRWLLCSMAACLLRSNAAGRLRLRRVVFLSLRSAGWSWTLELEWCERKTLLPDWWLETGAEVV